MKTFLTIFAALGLTFSALPVRSQAPVVPGPLAATLVQLRSIREQNAKLLEQQAATVKQLEEMEKTSQTLKLLGKRS